MGKSTSTERTLRCPLESVLGTDYLQSLGDVPEPSSKVEQTPVWSLETDLIRTSPPEQSLWALAKAQVGFFFALF